MITVINYFFPPVLAVYIHEYVLSKEKGEKKDWFKLLSIYCLYVLIIIILNSVVCKCLSFIDIYITPDAHMYTVVALIPSIILPYIFKSFKNNISVNIEIEARKKR